MAHLDEILLRAGCKKYNQPVETPDHPTKTHIVVVKDAGRTRVVRFGQKPTENKGKSGRRDFERRHGRKLASEKLSATYWRNFDR